MLSNNQIKQITSLKIKKFRAETGKFIAEGNKLVLDLLDSEFHIHGIFALPEWTIANNQKLSGKQFPVFETSALEMNRISALSTPSQVLAVVKMKNYPFTPSPSHPLTTSLSLALDDIRDPGNLGTIIRIADWFGISNIFCSPLSVDLYNPKVVQATMGSITRVNVFYTDLNIVFQTLSGKIPVYGSLLEGESLYKQTLSKEGIILIGNESRGISTDLLPWITNKVFIPFYGGSKQGKAESLNASMAAAIICAEFRRKIRE
jgi:RNA methyltransferase, TrmH family